MFVSLYVPKSIHPTVNLRKYWHSCADCVKGVGSPSILESMPLIQLAMVASQPDQMFERLIMLLNFQLKILVRV